MMISHKQLRQKSVNSAYDIERPALDFVALAAHSILIPSVCACYETLSNSGMKPSRLLHHFQTQQSDLFK